MIAKISKPAAFLDRDGVLIRDHGYVFRLQDLEILPGAIEGLKILHEQNYWLILVSNQSGVARGMFTTEDVDAFHAALQAELQSQLGYGLDGIYYCPHHPAGSVTGFVIDCNCRKPKPGLLLQAAQDFAIDWSRSLMVGDKISDIECAEAAGVKGIQLLAHQYQAHPKPFASIRSLKEIASYLQSIN